MVDRAGHPRPMSGHPASAGECSMIRKLALGVWVCSVALLAASGPAAAAKRLPDAMSLDAMSQAYHCGDHFRGHTVRGYLYRVKWTPEVYDHTSERPNETILVATCSK